jgi:MarR family transcriptional regulator, organic hydroperoxide resistance regulator
MILNKKVGVFLNLVHYRFKLYLSIIFQRHGFDITPEQFLVLDTLWDDGVLSQQEIAIKLQKDKNSVTKLIDALENKKLVQRIANKQDRRLNQIHITDSGQKIKNEVTEIAMKATDTIIKDIPKEDLYTFLRVLTKMSDNMIIKDESWQNYN